jgi:hypothetical protein
VAGSEPAAFGWRVTSGGVDVAIWGSLFVSAFDGIQFLDLDGFVPGAISQSFAQKGEVREHLKESVRTGGAPSQIC